MPKHLKHIKIAYRSSVVFLCLILLTQTQPATQSDKKVMINTPRRGTAASTSEHMQPPYSQKINIRFQDSDFYRTITNNNLFHPLGWQPSRQWEPHRLIGTLIPRDEQTGAQAILQSTTAGTTYIVNIGDRLDAETTVTDIQPKKVILEKAGQKPRVLTLNPTLLTK